MHSYSTGTRVFGVWVWIAPEPLYLDKGSKGSRNGTVIHAELIPLQCWHFGCSQSTLFILTTTSNFASKFTHLVTPPLTGTIAISTSFRAGTPFWEISDECPLKSLKASKMEVNQFKLIATRYSKLNQENLFRALIRKFQVLRYH